MSSRKALIVGINKYSSTNVLTGCINDATAISTVLERNGDGSPNFSTRLITDIQTKSELKSMIIKLFDGKHEIALLFFAGHGTLDDFGGGYIVTPDYAKNDVGISMDEILTIMNGSRATDRIVILDCCHSGAFGTPAVSGAKATQIHEGVTILTSSEDKGLSKEIKGHGVFTSLLLDALQGGAADLRGCISPGSVYAHIDQALGPWAQRPVFKTNVTRFITLRKVNPPIDLEILRKINEYFPSPEKEYSLNPSYEYTNAKNIEHSVIEPLANAENVAIFKNLQKFESVNLVKPVGEEHMYFAAMKSKSCKLTALGFHYWRLVKEGRI